MFLIALALIQTAPHPHTNDSPADAFAPRIDVSTTDKTLIELPARGTNHQHRITREQLVGPTIEYCKRMGRTRCENSVSAASGGAKVIVCKVRGRWRSRGW